MKSINFKKTLLLLAAISFAAACNTRNDTSRSTDTYHNNNNTTPAQTGNAEPGARTDTVTANGTMYQGGNSSNANTSTSSQQNATNPDRTNTSQNGQGQTGTTTERQTGAGGTGAGTAGAGPTVQGTGNSQNARGNTSDIASSDRNFAIEAYKGGHAEVKMANIAMERAQSIRVKGFAQMMVRDHTKANNELETILGRQNLMTDVEKENNKDDSHMEDMRNKTGRDFDVAYMRMMVNDHNKTIDLFRKESNSGKDNDLKDFATKTLPTLKMHLDSAKAIYGSLDRETSTRY